jgi:hypothetical protein
MEKKQRAARRKKLSEEAQKLQQEATAEAESRLDNLEKTIKEKGKDIDKNYLGKNKEI